MDYGGGGRAEGFGLEVGMGAGVAGGGGDAHCLGGGLDGLFDGEGRFVEQDKRQGLWEER